MSLSLAENVIVAGADNRPPMLDKTQYSSWASRLLLYIRGKENIKILIDSVLNGPFKYGIVTVPETPTTPATVKDRTYDELIDSEKIHEGCDINTTNIVLQGLPQDIYNLERESKLYDEFDMFTSAPRETIHMYYLRGNRTRGTNIVGQAKVIHCNNCQEEGHMARQCTKPKRSRNSTWFNEKAMLVEALELGVVLDEEQMAFLVDNGDTYSKQLIFNNDTNIDNDITIESNIISYEQYLNETKNTVVQATSSSAQHKSMIMFVIEDISNQVAKCNEVDKENKMINESLTAELESYKEQIKLFEERQQFDLNDRENYLMHHAQLSVIDTKETLELAEESRLKMHAKQNDPIMQEKKVNIAPIDYVALNKLSEHFVPQKKLST
ncbi:integrase, catalytic region, zinc finger, CCHC-type containing protein [Tanacetum coccineum]|uniref:Integrase, catalytic region, zinc finger, CCHC-type containing protein n=1 Tax=Tanacetum coccineum TaxID=301880 RepID=A0ABQ5FR16_9ASTR